MRTLLPFIVVGLANGSLYGLAGMGLVLTYKTSGIFNFAHGTIAAGGAYLFYELNDRRGLPWPIAFFVCVFVLAPLVGIGIERGARLLANARPAEKIAATVGLLLAVQGLITVVYGPITLNFPGFLPTGTVEVVDVNIGVDQLIVIGVALASAAALYLFFRVSRLGVTMRAVVDDPDLLGLTGTSAPAVRRWSWVIGSCFAAASGIFLAPSLGLDPILLTLLVVQAFGAAAIGRFSSLPLTYVGGLVVGVAASLSTKYVADIPALGGFPTSVPFIVLFVVLLVTPKRRLQEPEVARRTAGESRQLPVAVRRGAGVATGVALLVVPHVVGTRLPVFTNAAIFSIIFLSLGLLVRTSGQVSLAHAAFAALGASSFSHLADGAGLPWPLALLGAGLITVPLGAAVAIPAIRLSGIYLGLATFGFGILVEKMLFSTGFMFGRTGNRLAPRPEILGVDLTSDTQFYYVVLALVAVALAVVFAILRGRLGRLLRAMSDSPVALSTHGTTVAITRVIVFCVSAFLAGIAGALFASLNQSVSGQGFSTFASLTWLAVLTISGPGVVAPAFVASALIAVVPSYVTIDLYVDYQQVLFGVFAILAAMVPGNRMRIPDRLVPLRRPPHVAGRTPVADRVPLQPSATMSS